MTQSWSPADTDWRALDDEDESEPVEDLVALQQAELEVRGLDPLTANLPESAEWATAMRPARVSGLLVNPGANSFLITSSLDAANIRYVWDPYPPQLMPMYRPGYGAVDRPFTLLVHVDDLPDAAEMLAAMGITTSDWGAFSGPVTPDRTPEAEEYRFWRTLLFAVIYLFGMMPLLFVIPALILTREVRDVLRHAGALR